MVKKQGGEGGWERRVEKKKSSWWQCVVRTPAHSDDISSQRGCQHTSLVSLVRLKICLVLRPVLWLLSVSVMPSATLLLLSSTCWSSISLTCIWSLSFLGFLFSSLCNYKFSMSFLEFSCPTPTQTLPLPSYYGFMDCSSLFLFSSPITFLILFSLLSIPPLLHLPLLFFLLLFLFFSPSF